MTRNTEAFLDQRVRAEDIILGGLGFGEGASIVQLNVAEEFFSGTGRWDDGEEFTFESDAPPTDLELWAIGILLNQTLEK
ncbi:MAG: hypothetical protein KDD60_01320 [Bdellovibrionales bacterium]|nr:hypothetical protein [Bdellovibrionales bacterium]